MMHVRDRRQRGSQRSTMQPRIFAALSSKWKWCQWEDDCPLPPLGLRFPPFPVHSLLSSSLCFLLRSLKLVGLGCGDDALHPNFNGRMFKLLYLRAQYYCVSLHVSLSHSLLPLWVLRGTWTGRQARTHRWWIRAPSKNICTGALWQIEL